MDGMLCDRCGNVATHFHEDYGNVCATCAIHWTDSAMEAARIEDERQKAILVTYANSL